MQGTVKCGRNLVKNLCIKPVSRPQCGRNVPQQRIISIRHAQVEGTPIRSPERSSTAIVPAFSNLELMIQNTMQRLDGDWKEIEGCWVLRPPEAAGRPEAVVHFLGGAFVGAAPQLSYRLLLKALAARNVLVVTTPYATGFDHLRCVDEIQYKFTRCMGVLSTEVADLPLYGIGHSLGGVLHMLICSRYTVKRTGNIILSYNNKPATDVIPFLSPILAPGARMAGPFLAQLARSPFRSTIEEASDVLKGLSPSMVKQLIPLFEQLTPIYMDVSQGKQEFTPAPEETGTLIRSYYSIPKNLIIKFQDDTLDESAVLAMVIQGLSTSADVSVKTLPGDHLRPLQQAFVDLPPEVAKVANQAVMSGGAFVSRLAQMMDQAGVSQAQQPLSDLSKGMEGMASVFGGNAGGPITDSVQQLADEIALWMRVGGLAAKGTLPLPNGRL